MKSLFALTITCLALASASSTALAQKNWKVASAAQPGSVLIGFVDEFATKTTADTKGEVKVERLFIASEQETMQQVVRGRVEVGNVSLAGASVLIPEASLLNVPYLWTSNAERDFVTDRFALPVLKKIYEAKGLVILGLGEVGWNDVVCKTACLTPASVKGMKVRISPSPASKMFWNSLGANGVQMPLSELFPALQSGLVEAADLPFPYYVTTPAAQSTPHYVLTQHLHHPSAFFVNKAAWDGLTADQRRALQAATPEVARARKAVDDDVKPKMEEFKKKGGFVHELTPAQRNEWRKLVEPNQDELVKSIGGAAPELWAAIQRGKKEFAATGGK
jgi:TRAP-type C4-dicarboxylate transport system substrate-binding protein